MRLILRTGPPDEVHAGMELEARVQAGRRGGRRAGATTSWSPTIPLTALGNPYLICNEIAGETIVRRIHRTARRRGPPAAAALSARPRWPPFTVPSRDGRICRRGPAAAVARPTRRDGRHHGDVRVGVPLAGRQPAGAGHSHAGARRFPDGQSHRRRARHGWPRCWTGNWCTSGSRARTWRGSASGPGGSARRSRLAARAGWAASRTSCRLTRGGRHPRRPGRVPLVAGAGHPALGGDLPVPGRAPPVRADPSVELAAIGRRVCETEWDLLNLMEKTPPGDDAGRVPAPPDGGPCSGPRRSRAIRRRSRAIRPDRAVRPPQRRRTRRRRRRIPRARCTGIHRGQVNFHARVAANVLRIVERELPAARQPVAEALARLGFADEAQLAAAIRRGALDDRAADVTDCLRALVSHRLAVAHPGYQHE